MSNIPSDPKDLIILQLLKRIKILEKKIGNNNVRSDVDTVDPGSSKTTASDRKALRKHIQDLENLAKNKAKPIVVIPPNTFKLGQIVELPKRRSEAYKKGIIKYIACKLALPSIKKCDKDTCEHDKKDFIWVAWPSRKTFAYHYSKLNLMSEEDLKPKIGIDISGRIGEWTFDVKTGLWKKDGSNKTYTKQEFDDILYFERNPWDRSDGDALIKLLQKPKPLTELHANLDITE